MPLIFENNPRWLIPDSMIDLAFKEASDLVYELYKNKSSGSRNDTFYLIEFFFHKTRMKFLDWSKGQLNYLIRCCCGEASVDLRKVHPSFAVANTYVLNPMPNYFKLVLIVMWSRKQIVLPLNFKATMNRGDILDEIIDLSESNILKGFRASAVAEERNANTKEKQEIKTKYTRWIKLAISGQVYNKEDLTPEYCRDLYRESFGRGKPLAQYRVPEYLYFLAGDHLSIKDMIEEVMQAEKATARRTTTIPKAGSKATSPRKSVADICCQNAIEYGQGNRLMIFPDAYTDTVKPLGLKSVFDMHDGKVVFYPDLPDRVASFCRHVDLTFRSFLKSKRLQNEKNPVFVINLLLAYLSTYLPNFCYKRDFSLQDYPQSFNDLNCTLYFTRDANFVDGLLKYEKEPPLTFLRFMKGYAEHNRWTNETLYARTLIVDEFCEWVQEHRHEIPKATKFKANFSSACYPPVRRRAGTVKRPVPRAYFGAFVSMLYSLEYLIMHLNSMAEGKVCGILGGELYQPTLCELQSSGEWETLWGSGNGRLKLLDLSKLNYSPIFYCDGKAHRLEFVPRFYSIQDYEIDGALVERIVPNHIRIVQLMCETGMRQKHLIWLDKDRFDCFIDRFSQTQLCPLLVSTDKSHGEWTAIVSRRVIDILDRQSHWYSLCSSSDFKTDLWYGMKEGSKFGRFKPLFRMLTKSEGAWACYRYYPAMLLMLQYFIQVQMNAPSSPELVYMRSSEPGECESLELTKEFLDGAILDHLVSKYTPHGLRAGFVSEAIRFLPASIVGQYMTGQSEPHVWFYAVFGEDELPTHQQILADYLLKNSARISSGQMPELAEALLYNNERLACDVKGSTENAIKLYGLVSLIGVREDKNGIEVMRAKKGSGLSYNPTHICPFKNVCPRDVIDTLGAGRPCALCPYAIRGVVHLPAVSAEKDKCKEQMLVVLRKLRHYRRLNSLTVDRQMIETLSEDHDRYAREAFAYEAIEQQLYKMAVAGHHQGLFVPKKDDLVDHFRRVELTEGEQFLKRLVDVQNFPDASSSELDTKFAYFRARLVISEGEPEAAIPLGEHPPGIELASQISSMVNSGALDVLDVFKIAQMATRTSVPVMPDSVITKRIEKTNLESENG